MNNNYKKIVKDCLVFKIISDGIIACHTAEQCKLFSPLCQQPMQQYFSVVEFMPYLLS